MPGFNSSKAGWVAVAILLKSFKPDYTVLSMIPIEIKALCICDTFEMLLQKLLGCVYSITPPEATKATIIDRIVNFMIPPYWSGRVTTEVYTIAYLKIRRFR